MKKLKEFYEKHATWINIFFAVTTIISTIFAVYTYYNPVNLDAKLRFVFQSKNYLVNSEKKIADLEITYKGRDIRNDSLNLLVQKIKIMNCGKGSIKESDYSSDPFCLRILNAKIVAVEVVPEEYCRSLAASLKPKVVNGETIQFNKVMFNPNEAVTLNIYILHNPKKKFLDYFVLGKIASQDNLRVIDTDDLDSEKSTLQTVWGWIKVIAEIVFYLAVVVVPFAILIAMIQILRDKARRAYILKLYGHPATNLSETQEGLVEVYVCLGKDDFISLLDNLQSIPNYIEKEEAEIKAMGIVEISSSIKTKELENTSEYYLCEDLLKDYNLIVPFEFTYAMSEEFKKEIPVTLRKIQLK